MGRNRTTDDGRRRERLALLAAADGEGWPPHNEGAALGRGRAAGRLLCGSCAVAGAKERHGAGGGARRPLREGGRIGRGLGGHVRLLLHTLGGATASTGPTACLLLREMGGWPRELGQRRAGRGGDRWWGGMVPGWRRREAWSRKRGGAAC
jgi:hypothetical protein